MTTLALQVDDRVQGRNKDIAGFVATIAEIVYINQKRRFVACWDNNGGLGTFSSHGIKKFVPDANFGPQQQQPQANPPAVDEPMDHDNIEEDVSDAEWSNLSVDEISEAEEEK